MPWNYVAIVFLALAGTIYTAGVFSMFIKKTRTDMEIESQVIESIRLNMGFTLLQAVFQEEQKQAWVNKVERVAIVVLFASLMLALGATVLSTYGG